MSDTSAFVVMIPARLGSTRLPNKPLLDLAGQPMIVRVAQRAQASGIATVIVATDSSDILAACAQAHIRAIATQPNHLSGTDRLAEAVDILQLPDSSIVINLQGDEPLIEPTLLLQVAIHLQQHADCVMATAAHPIDHPDELFNSNIVKVVCDNQGRALYFSRAAIPWLRGHYEQYSVPITEHKKSHLDENLSAAPLNKIDTPYAPPPTQALRHIGIYAYRAAFLRRFPNLNPAPLELAESLEQLRVLWHGERIAVLRISHAPPAGVDTPEDLERVRKLLVQQNA